MVDDNPSEWIVSSQRMWVKPAFEAGALWTAPRKIARRLRAFISQGRSGSARTVTLADSHSTRGNMPARQEFGTMAFARLGR